MRNNLYLRLSSIFLLVLLLIGSVYIFITVLTARNYFQETTQRLHSNVAEHMLLEVTPFTDGEVNKEAVDKIMHSMMAVNPSLEVYLLDPNGEILSYVVFEKDVMLKRVDMEPVQQFIDTKGEELIFGDDPRNPKGSAIFSSTAVYTEEQLMGYVYIVLVSEKYQNVTATLIGSYALTLGAKLLLITFLSALLIGLTLIWLLTRNLRRAIQTFKRFEAGDLHARIPEENAKGELLILSRTFNKMADRILQNIDELKKVDSLRRELIANVSHDLRNPMAVIHGYIETLILKEGSISPEDRTKYLNIVLNVSDKLRKLISDLFELSKLETNQIELKKEPFPINELVSDSINNFEILAKEKDIAINKNVSQQMPQVYADIALIDRVIQNLLDNAIKYTPPEGHINLDVLKQENSILVCIENSGKGIPAKDIPHIFDRYYTINKEENNIGGTGLGLAISKRIMEKHDSDILVSSEEEGLTRFEFTLPVYN